MGILSRMSQEMARRTAPMTPYWIGVLILLVIVVGALVYLEWRKNQP